MRYETEREEVVRTAQEMERAGLTIGTHGNVSARVPEGAIVTPSSLVYSDMVPSDTVLMDLEGTVIEGERVPSVEHKVHLGLYRARADVMAVIHAHPTFSSAFAAARLPLPGFLDEFGVFVGDEVRVADYALSGSDDMADNVVKAMGESANAAFMASHGVVAAGRDLARALQVALKVERGAQVYLWARLLGGPVDLPDDAKTLFGQIFEYLKTV